MASGKRIKIKMVSSEGTGHFYTTTVNPQNTTTKLELMKFDPVSRKKTKYVQSKIK